ncbi:MAG: 1,4-dihydroxy-2-naphthoate polyprenyltransferase [Chthoniobacterales bacterium]|nr:1,4-dihydroxy-2-naphthoate polyprenyltransferase [Chthoniobacterales bacterium]
MHPWILAARPRTLGAAVVPVVAGAALAAGAGEFDTVATILIMICAVLIQIATNFFNDAIDHAKGADTADRIGPVRVTSAGLLSARAVLTMGFIMLILAVLFSLPLVLRGGWPILALGAVSLLLTYAYTGGPLPLAYLGLGELFVIIFFGLASVAGTFYLNTLEISVSALLAGLQIGLHSSVLLAVNNLRDIDGDRAVGKMTLAARFGMNFARRENAALVLAPFVLGVLWLPLGYLWVFLIPLVTLPSAWWLARACLAASPGREVNQLLAQAAALHAAFGLCLAVGFLLP